MCECVKREDGTWHVDECCASIMDEYHSGTGWVEERERLRSEMLSIIDALQDAAYTYRERNNLAYAKARDTLRDVGYPPLDAEDLS